MKVLFFAQSRQIAGCEAYCLVTERALTPGEFWARLVEVFPGVAQLQKGARLARQESYLGEDELLLPGDEIAVIPQVSGG